MARVIAIDGPAGAGKSTVARMAAAALGFTYLDSGSLYRAVTRYLLDAGVRPDEADDAKLDSCLSAANIRMMDGHVSINGRDVTDLLRDPVISDTVSMFSARAPVRKKLLAIQRASAVRDIIVDGRDIGTVVFPSAFLKIYLDAHVSVRAARRMKELEDAGRPAVYEQVHESLRSRDEHDSQRKIAPLSRAPDAVYLDTTHVGIEDVIGIVRAMVHRRSQPVCVRLWHRIFYRTTWVILKVVSKLYLRRTVRGAENVDGLEGPGILASNHASHLDPPLVAVSMRRPLSFFAKRELVEIPVFGRLIIWLSVIAVRRGIIDHEAIYNVRAALSGDTLLLVFPEGTRTRDGRIHDARSGFGKLVLECGVPVIPVRIVDSGRAFPPGGWWPRPYPVKIIYGKPFVPEAARAPSNGCRPAGTSITDLRPVYDRIGEEVMAKIRALGDE